ncbi:DUF58 domain-containing protein [Singulisphaera acidiphila]|uniref:DUF58 domain-containing protein n=1 Tax=Singulisphaera acidiphila (strain ATCC BAA-1392 / DSM 18658 / VKM B-2454 / MOB10) TaxID=886293 RepID=L0DCA8_SINAD|nr:DUF58 domain-containing protein [Singulisphaera acidiphila]AGA26468.1 hypothetical protein Sinac_2134 [Singulisphaera acidiphila DSM 18658]
MSTPSLHHSIGAIPLIVRSEPNEAEFTSKWNDLLTHDYFPSVNPYIRWMWTPLGTLGLSAVAAGLCGMILHPRGFVILVGILSVIGLGVAWPWLGLRGLHGTLNFDRDRAREGEAVGLKATLGNRLPWGTCGLTLEGAFLTNGPADNQPIIAGLAVFRGWRTTELTLRVTLECRGEYPTRLPRVASGFPFGLVKASRTLSCSSKILVWPQTFPVGPIPETTGQGVDGVAPRDRSGTTGDMIGVRPYRRGDSLRRVHWPQSARHDRLVICELHADSVPRVQVLLDLHDGAHAGSGSKGSREWAIRIAASFLEDWIGQGAEVEFVFQERVVFAREGSTQAKRAQMLDAVARIAPDGSVSLPELLAISACRRFRTGLRVVVTTDLGLRGLTRRPSRGVKDLFVVLRAAAFMEGGRDDERSPLPIAPWIWIDDPARIPERIRRAWKEVPLVR